MADPTSLTIAETKTERSVVGAKATEDRTQSTKAEENTQKDDQQKPSIQQSTSKLTRPNVSHSGQASTTLCLDDTVEGIRLDRDTYFPPEPISWVARLKKTCSELKGWFYEQRLAFANRLLLGLESREEHVKNWRPQILIVVKEATDSDQLTKMLTVAEQLKAGKGLTMAMVLLPAAADDPMLPEKLNEMADFIQGHINKVRINCNPLPMPFKNYSVLPDVLWVAIQSAGLGVLTPNTILVQYPKESVSDPDELRYWFMIHCTTNLGMCLLIPKGDFPVESDQQEMRTGNIDIWWILHQGGIVLLMSFLFKKHRIWRRCQLRIFAVAEEGDNKIEMEKGLNDWLYQLRINANVIIVSFERHDIETYAIGRTMNMNERRKLQMLLKEHLGQKNDSKQRNPQAIADDCHIRNDEVNRELSEKEKLPAANVLNKAMVERSLDSHLIVVNLPRPPTVVEDMPDYLKFLEDLTAGLKRVLLVRGTDTEVITYY